MTKIGASGAQETSNFVYVIMTSKSRFLHPGGDGWYKAAGGVQFCRELLQELVWSAERERKN